MQPCSADLLCGAKLLLERLDAVDTILYILFFLFGGLNMNLKDQCCYMAVRALVTAYFMNWQMNTMCDVIFSNVLLIVSVLHGVVFFRFLARVIRILDI